MLRLAFFLAVISAAAAAPPPPANQPAPLPPPAMNRINATNAAWRDLAAAFAKRPAVTADFEERRWFAFRKTPTVLKGEVRVANARGLSLHYREPEERTVILDRAGMLVRQQGQDRALPSDPRASAANQAMLHILTLDLPALAETFDLYGEHGQAGWKLALVPRTESLRQALGQIHVSGEGATVSRIELKRSTTQYIEIQLAPPRGTGEFNADELRRYFR